MAPQKSPAQPGPVLINRYKDPIKQLDTLGQTLFNLLIKLFIRRYPEGAGFPDPVASARFDKLITAFAARYPIDSPASVSTPRPIHVETRIFWWNQISRRVDWSTGLPRPFRR